MCTERNPDEIVVCDVAVADVRDALAGLDVVITHLPYEGNLVANGRPEERDAFRARLDAALRPHGGALA